jgi:hypothetical protein
MLERFDYRGMAPPQREFLRRAASEIRESMKKTAKEIWNTGKWLTLAKAQMDHGRWGLWLAREFAMTDRTARRYMETYEQFKTDTVSDLTVSPSGMLLLAAKNTPEEVRQKLLEDARSGKHVSQAMVKAAIAEHADKEMLDPQRRSLGRKSPESSDVLHVMGLFLAATDEELAALASQMKRTGGEELGRKLKLLRQRIETLLERYLEEKP